MSGAREQLIELYCAAIAGADIESLTTHAVASVPLERRNRVWVLAFGKAAHAMAGAAVGALQRALAEIAGGIVVAPEAGDAPVGTVNVMVGDHPVPGRRSFAAAARIGQILKEKRGNDLGIVLISGGASSIIGAPLRGMSEPDFSQLFDLVLGSGLDINGMNAIRKRFSFWGAGRMALALAPAPTHCFAVSDVPGDDLPTIGSGPCVPDPTRVHQVIELMQRTGVYGKISSSLRQYLVDCARGVIPETPKIAHPAFAHVTARVIANNDGALNAAANVARRSSMTATVTEQPLVGDAASAGTRVAEALLAAKERAQAGSAHCVIWGGETTVALRLPAAPGGRCQELALSVAKRLGEAGDRATGISVLAAGTDGRDGATDAAGAVVDWTTWNAIAAAGRDPAHLLRVHESYDALSSVNALFKPGLTGTNVMDVVIGIVKRDS
ncbi:MAG: glycerate kinase type-2 family protein [Gemmatimonadaceae bacterium]